MVHHEFLVQMLNSQRDSVGQPILHALLNRLQKTRAVTDQRVGYLLQIGASIREVSMDNKQSNTTRYRMILDDIVSE